MSNSCIDYIDNYSACDSTYATLRIYSGEEAPEIITRRLGIVPTKMSFSNSGIKGKVNGWFLCTEGHVNSKDSRRHIDWLLDRLESLEDSISELRADGVRIDICCFWRSSTGNGGPVISPKQMKRLVPLGLDVWWDVWFS